MPTIPAIDDESKQERLKSLKEWYEYQLRLYKKTGSTDDAVYAAEYLAEIAELISPYEPAAAANNFIEAARLISGAANENAERKTLFTLGFYAVKAGRLYLNAYLYELAQNAFETALDAYLKAAEPGSTEDANRWSRLLINLGDLKRGQGKLDEALAFYRERENMLLSLYENDPSAELLEDLAEVWSKIYNCLCDDPKAKLKDLHAAIVKYVKYAKEAYEASYSTYDLTVYAFAADAMLSFIKRDQLQIETEFPDMDIVEAAELVEKLFGLIAECKKDNSIAQKNYAISIKDLLDIYDEKIGLYADKAVAAYKKATDFAFEYLLSFMEITPARYFALFAARYLKLLETLGRQDFLTMIRLNARLAVVLGAFPNIGSVEQLDGVIRAFEAAVRGVRRSINTEPDKKLVAETLDCVEMFAESRVLPREKTLNSIKSGISVGVAFGRLTGSNEFDEKVGRIRALIKG